MRLLSMRTKMQFFNSFHFEWNAAKENDWPKIRKNFVAAYISSYCKRTVEELQFGSEVYQHAKDFFNKHAQNGYQDLLENVIKPLTKYLSHEKNPLLEESNLIKEHFDDLFENENAAKARQYIIKLIMLQHYFEEDFDQEHKKIHSGSKKIDYLIVRFSDHPVAFFATELNYKSGHVYLRFVTVSPAFHNLGLGKNSLMQIAKHYPQATGMELYTRNANHAAKGFYNHEGFKASLFDFKEHDLLDSMRCHFPTDDSTSHPESFVGYCKLMKPSFS